MITFLELVAFVSGILAVGLVAAAVIGLVDNGPADEKPNYFMLIADHLFTGGLGVIVGEMRRSWSRKPAERRMLCAGVICGDICLLSLYLIAHI